MVSFFAPPLWHLSDTWHPPSSNFKRIHVHSLLYLKHFVITLVKILNLRNLFRVLWRGFWPFSAFLLATVCHIYWVFFPLLSEWQAIYFAALKEIKLSPTMFREKDANTRVKKQYSSHSASISSGYFPSHSFFTPAPSNPCFHLRQVERARRGFRWHTFDGRCGKGRCSHSFSSADRPCYLHAASPLRCSPLGSLRKRLGLFKCQFIFLARYRERASFSVGREKSLVRSQCNLGWQMEFCFRALRQRRAENCKSSSFKVPTSLPVLTSVWSCPLTLHQLSLIKSAYGEKKAWFCLLPFFSQLW